MIEEIFTAYNEDMHSKEIIELIQQKKIRMESTSYCSSGYHNRLLAGYYFNPPWAALSQGPIW